MCFKGVVGGSFLEDIWGLARSRRGPKRYSDEVGAENEPYLHDGVDESREK